MEESELWAEFARTRSVDVRNAIAERYLPLVSGLVRAMKKSINMDPLDMASVGAIGLINAIERFEPERGFAFGTYAPHKIRSAILDEARSMDWVPRLERSRRKKCAAAAESLASRHGREPTKADIAKAVGLSQAEVLRLTAPLPMFRNPPAAKNDNGDARLWENAISRDPSPHEDEDQRDSFEDLICGLTQQEQVIVTLYYRESMTMKAIGTVIGVCESRVSQTHDKALQKIKDRYS